MSRMRLVSRKVKKARDRFKIRRSKRREVVRNLDLLGFPVDLLNWISSYLNAGRNKSSLKILYLVFFESHPVSTREKSWCASFYLIH